MKVVLQIELLRSNSRLGSLMILLDVVHTRGKSPQDRLRDVQTCRITLVSAYVLHYLFICYMVTTSDKRKKSEMGVSTNWCIAIEH